MSWPLKCADLKHLTLMRMNRRCASEIRQHVFHLEKNGFIVMLVVSVTQLQSSILHATCSPHHMYYVTSYEMATVYSVQYKINKYDYQSCFLLRHTLKL